MSDSTNIDNVRYSFEAQEYFQRQLEEAVNTLINKNNTENDKAFNWFMGFAGGGGIKSLIEDTSPQLGGDLDILARGITSSNTIMNSTLSGTGKSLVLGF